MNELDEIRALLPQQPPPSDELMADVRARLAGQPRPARRWSRVVVPLAAAAVVAAVAVTVVSLPRDDSPPAARQTTAPGTTTAPPSNQDILLTAADRLAAKAGDTGRFWRTRYLEGDNGSGPVTYITETWLSGEGHESDWRGRRDLEVTPADKGEIVQLSVDYQRLPVGPRVRDLPTDAAGLRAALLESWQGSSDPAAVNNFLFVDAVWLLTQTPALPRTQAAALRLIAGLGVVEHLGPVTDPLGRDGTAVRFTRTSQDYTDTTELAFDRDGTLLSIRYAGLKNYYVAVVSDGWTDDTPRIPSPNVP